MKLNENYNMAEQKYGKEKVIQIKYHLSFFTKLGQQLYYYLIF